MNTYPFWFFVGLVILLGGCATTNKTEEKFTGEITYKIAIHPKSDTVDVQALRSAKPGLLVKYIVTDKNYKSSYYDDGEFQYSYTYHDDTKLIYDNYADKPYITYRDSRKDNNEYTEPAIYKDSLIKIESYDAYPVISETDTSITTSYYSDSITIDYHAYQQHEVGNWNKRLEVVNGGINLKSISEYETHYDIKEAIAINRKPVNKKTFSLPDSKPIVASFFALDQQAKIRPPDQDQIQCYQNLVSSVDKPDDTKKHTIHVSFIVNKNGEISLPTPYQKDALNFYKAAVDIINNCDFEFIPGKIDGKPVDSEVYLPVVF